MSSGPAPEFWLLKIPNALHDQWTHAKEANAATLANSAFPKTPAQLAMTLGQPIGHVWIEKNAPKTGGHKKVRHQHRRNEQDTTPEREMGALSLEG